MKIKNIISDLTVCAIVCTSLQPFNSCAEKESYREAYSAVLHEFMESEYCTKFSGFSLYDISGDGIPELIIGEDTCHYAACRVYSFQDSLIDLGKMGTYGEIGYYSDNNIIVQYDLSQGYEFTSYSRLENGGITTLAYFNNNYGAAAGEPELYFKINEENVTHEEYEAALDEYRGETYKSLGHDYKFSEQSIKNAISGNSRWRELYRDKLYELRQSEGYSEDFMFDLYDINGDEIPELFINNYFYAPAEIYTVSEGELISLGVLGNGHDRVSLYYRPNPEELLVHCGSEVHSLMKLENLKLTVTDEFIKVTDGYEHNGEIVSWSDYSDVIFASPSVWIGRKYHFGDAAIEYALRTDDMMTNIREAAYIYKLFQLKAEFIDEEYDYEPIADAQFELCDLDGDGYAELAFSPSTSYAGGACSIYTLGYGGKLVECGHLGIYGNFSYNAEMGLVYTLNGRMGMYHGNFYKLSSGELEKVISYEKADEEYVDERKSMGIDDDYYYKLNGEEVSRDEYYSAIEKYENEEDSMLCGRRNVLTIDGIAEEFFGGDSLVPKIKTIGNAVKGAGYLNN